MHAILLGAVLASGLLLFESSGHAQGLEPALMKTVEAFEAASHTGNAQVWSRYVAEDALFTGVDGYIENKVQRLAKVRSRTAPAARKYEERYRIYGDTAIRTWRQEGTNNGSARADRRIEVWVRQHGEWKLASLQITSIP